MTDLLHDVRYGLRMLAKSPGFTLVAVLTLALGIGANTAIFTVVRAVLLRPLPYPAADRLLYLNEESPQLRGMSIAYPDLLDWQMQSKALEQIAGTQPTGLTITGGERPEQVPGRNVSGNFFSTLGVQPALGRFFTPDEDKPGGTPVVVISYALWQRRFGGESSVIARALVTSDRSYSIVGVLPRDFMYRQGGDDVFLALGRNAADMKDRGSHPGIYAIARMKPGVTLEQARSELKTIAARLAQQYPDSNANISVAAGSYREVIVGDARGPLLTLFAAVAFVLLIACANVANLLLARASGREREIAVRMALGATRARLARQLLTESALLSLLGAILGLLLAAWGIDVLVRAAPDALPRVREIHVDGIVLAFTALAAMLTGVIFGVAPALHASSPHLYNSLKEGTRSVGGTARHKLRGALVIAEIALSLVLLAGAGLLIRSFARLMDVNPGLNPHNVFTAQLFLPDARYATSDKTRDFYQRLLARLNTLPGVKSAATTTPLPFDGSGWQTDYRLEDRPRPNPGEYPNGDIHYVSSGYIATMEVPLLRGRTFTEADRWDSPPVILVNQAFARRWWPNEDPIGKRIRMPAGPQAQTEDDAVNPWRTVVGLVGDVKQYGLDADIRTEVYIPLLQREYPRRQRDGRPTRPLTYVNIVLRTTGDPLALTDSVRNAVAEIDKDQPITQPQSMEQLLAASVASRRSSMFLLATFAALALGLAAVGIYGVMSYTVTLRTREIGIRMALGAARYDVLKMVIGQALRMAAIGLGLGLVLALALSRLIARLLFGVKPADPITFAAITALLGLVALLASAAPARRATKVDPMVALRYE